MTTLSELRERLEKAGGPDPQIDYDLWHDVYQGPDLAERPYTASLDAAIALVEAKLPGWARMMTEYPDGIFEYRLGRYNGHWDEHSGHHFAEEARYTHKSEPIALLLALLSALEKESAE